MHEFKGTKGKWFVSSNSIKDYELDGDTRRHGKIDISTNDWGSFIQCFRHEMNENDNQSKANALLISKAPEMLDMILLLVDRLEENGLGTFSAVERAKKLIKEATEL